MLETKVTKPNLDKLKLVLQKQANNLKLCKPFKLSMVTQFYPPDYAATGQLIEELAIHLERIGINIQVFTGQPGYAFREASAPHIENFNNIQIRRSRIARLFPARIRGKAINGLLFFLRSALHLLKSSSRGDVLLLTTAP